MAPVAFGVGIAVALWLYDEGGVLIVCGVAIVGAALWEFVWERPRRNRLRAEMAKGQQAAGTQALQSEVGKPHWTDRLPQPLRAIAQVGPFTLMAIGVFMLALVLISVFGELGVEELDTHVRLEEGSSGEVEPKLGEDYRIRVTILTIVDEVEVLGQAPKPDRGYRYWAAEVSIENLGTRDASSPSWLLADSLGHRYERTPVVATLDALPRPAALGPGEPISGWIVFEIRDLGHPKWLRVTPPDPFGRYEPNHLYFDAEE